LTVAFSYPRDVRMGRDSANEVYLAEDNASRLHAVVRYDGSTLRVEDANSRNGVFVNGVKQTEATLAIGDVVVLASSVFRIERAPQSLTLDRETTAMPTAVRTPSGRLPALDTCAEYHGIVDCLLRIQEILAADREDMVQESMEALFDVLPATRLSLLIRRDGEEKLEQLHTVTRSGPSPEYVGRAFARRVLMEGRAQRIDDSEALGPKELTSTMELQKIRSTMGVPLYAGGNAVGVLMCDNLERPNAFTQEHVGLLEFAGRALQAAFQRSELRALERKQFGLEQQLIAARVVQDQIFNKNTEDIRGPLRWWVHYESALEVGGDFYDFYHADDRTLWVVADVCGKGVPAALVVSMLKAFCKGLYPQNLSPAEFAVALHDLARGEIPRDMFFTAAFLSVDADGLLTYASCGQEGVFRMYEDGQVEQLPVGGALMGMPPMDEAVRQVKDRTTQLKPKQRLLVCTDGVTEAGDPRRLFGIDRLVEAFKASAEIPGNDALHRILDVVHEHEGTKAANDDKTLVLAEFLD
jgi:serine phosphatase RsbU (regulator of sigma subunit)/pSer/pThr/pTyr-binding forkhead associated (FHA) protein